MKGKISVALILSLAFFLLPSLLVLGAEFQLTVSTDREVYSAGAVVSYSGFFLAEGSPVAWAALTIAVADPSGSPIWFDQLVTDSQGRFSSSFTLKADSPPGTYKLMVGADQAQAAVSFQVLASTPTPTPTSSSTPTPNSTFTPTPTSTPSSSTTTPTSSSTPSLTFPDIQDHWARGEIEKLVSMGIVNGYPDGLFRPEGKITRAEFTKMVVLALELKLENPQQATFSDVPNSFWGFPYIEAAYKAGIVKGVGEGQFAPDRQVTRAEIAAMVVRALKLPPGPPVLFQDADQIPSFAVELVGAAVQVGIIKGYPDNTFRPLNDATRAEASVMIVRMVNFSRG